MPSSSVSSPNSLRLPFTASSVGVARSTLRTWMTENGVDQEAIEDARLIVSELVANSVRHAQPLSDGSLVVCWTVAENGSVDVAVTDGGSPTSPRAMTASSVAVSGRGMAIVDMLSVRWWTERTAARSTVHALMRC